MAIKDLPSQLDQDQYAMDRVFDRGAQCVCDDFIAQRTNAATTTSISDTASDGQIRARGDGTPRVVGMARRYSANQRIRMDIVDTNDDPTNSTRRR